MLQWKPSEKRKWNCTQTKLSTVGEERVEFKLQAGNILFVNLFQPRQRDNKSCGRMKKPRQRSDTLFQGFVVRHKDVHTQADSPTRRDTRRCFSYKLLSKPSVKLFWANLKVALSHINHVIACAVL